jgi:hypothetical protein
MKDTSMAGAAKKDDAPEGEQGKEVVVPPEGTTDMAIYEGYEADVGMGFEGQTAEDISVPFLEVLQPGSPEVQGEDGLKSGQIINRTTGEFYSGKDGVAFIPVTTQHVVVEWVPRDNGGGIVGTHQLDDPMIVKVRASQPLGKYTHPENGNDLIETFYVYGIFCPPDGAAPHPAVIAFSSTKIKPYKDWMFRARSIVIALPNGRKLTKLPLFSHRYLLTSVFVEKNNYKWYNWLVKFDGENAEGARIAPNDELYATAKSLCEDIAAGRKVADTANVGTREDVADRSPQGEGDRQSGDAPY